MRVSDCSIFYGAFEESTDYVHLIARNKKTAEKTFKKKYGKKTAVYSEKAAVFGFTKKETLICR